MKKSKNNPYKSFTKEQLILRDHLAIDRTVLSNESTLLAYIRTGLAVIAAGATLVHFFIEIYVQITGGIIIIAGILILILGYKRYRNMDKSIKEIERI
ncbi:MAG: hypothetical protein ACD_37C00089G0014 [uncultured bacterium]|nr:MAG: hypothetical protein ACD_37C00089G0014 [uncultured bacterium]